MKTNKCIVCAHLCIQIDHTTAASALTSTIEKNYSVDLYYTTKHQYLNCYCY